eukprot:g27685.t1
MWLTHSIFSLFGESWISRDPNGSNEIQTLTLPTARPLLPPGAVFELEGGGKLPGELVGRLKSAALEALRRHHWDAAASLLVDLPHAHLWREDLIEAAEYLLRSSCLSANLSALTLWTRLLSELRPPAADAAVLRRAWLRFWPSALYAARWREGEDMALWREALWTTIRRWQLTPERPTFLAAWTKFP